MSEERVRSAFRLDGRRAFVVGGYGGIGSAICELLAAEGAAVAVAGRSKERAADFAAELSRHGTATIGCALDVTQRDSVAQIVADVAQEWSGIDILVNCASMLVTEKAEDMAAEDWCAVIEANLTGAFWLSQEVGRRMIAAGSGGRIIHLSSVRSMAGGRNGFAAYGSSKAGLNLLVKQLATEWGRHGITVNGVAPGFVQTELVERAAQDRQFLEIVAARTPLGRLAEPTEVAAAVLFFASPLARFITGQILFVDGGVTASQ
jgi:NAD(P)-dependent dehydrogenase (short-subunit alcohol dehydrogenase family)